MGIKWSSVQNMLLKMPDIDYRKTWLLYAPQATLTTARGKSLAAEVPSSLGLSDIECRQAFPNDGLKPKAMLKLGICKRLRRYCGWLATSSNGKMR